MLKSAAPAASASADLQLNGKGHASKGVFVRLQQNRKKWLKKSEIPSCSIKKVNLTSKHTK